jgi:hypothetical protein
LSRTLKQATQWAHDHPTKTVGAGGPSWDGWCAALMYWVGGFTRSADTAALARRSSKLSSATQVEAPAGVFHWWDIAGIEAGHVGLDLTGRGRSVLMATRAVTQSWGDHLGTNSVFDYGATVPSTYRGWSYDFVGQQLDDEDLRATAKRLENVVLQQLAATGGYTGPIDGTPGPRTWIALQRLLQPHGYRGAVDGFPGVQTMAALQRLARTAGYTGPLDGDPGPATLTALRRLGGGR